MSSHHIVREDQEPALFILNAHAISFAHIEQLLEWSPTVIVVEQAIEPVLSWGIKIDVVIVSQIYSASDELLNQEPIQLIHTNETLLNAAISLVIGKKFGAINFLVSEEFDLDLIAKMPKGIDVVAFCKSIRFSLIRGGVFEKWLPSETKLYVHSSASITTTGLTSKLEVVETGAIRIESPELFWVGESV
jgi:thiamine pyrophosphokinase